jgi:hypothetical protein
MTVVTPKTMELVGHDTLRGETRNAEALLCAVSEGEKKHRE